MYETLIQYSPEMMMAVLGATGLAFLYFAGGMAVCCIRKNFFGYCKDGDCGC